MMKFSLFFFFLPNLIFGGWVDPDTKDKHKLTYSLSSGKKYELIMSDEFNRDGRSFKDGHDPMWTALDKSDDDQTSQGRKSLHYYNSSNVKTKNGHLVITTNTEDTKWKGWDPYQNKYIEMKRHFKSGMLQGWNKFCFTGGILEIDVMFPGAHDIGGLWPALWLLGNLGRATYEASTNLMWPWSYSECNRELQRAQEISGCDVTTHYSLNPNQGRGATEIDIIEVMPGPKGKLPIVKNNVGRPYSSMTLQMAPGIPASQHRPPSGTLPEWGFNWYENLTYGENTSINPFFYGTYLAETNKHEPVSRSKDESYQCDALSSMVQLNESHFNKMHTFRLEWQPGKDGYLHWYMDGVLRFGVEQAGLDKHHTLIPNEPSYVIINTAVSTSWGFPDPSPGCNLYDCKDPDGQCGFNPGFCKTLPAEFHIDFIRIYQDKNDSSQTIGCNPRKYPTKRWIAAHAYRYKLQKESTPLKDVVTGGGSCGKDSECGEGICRFSRCRCSNGWQGPFCLVPNYKNDFKDWDTQNWAIFVTPQIPSFLGFGFIIFILILVVTTYFVAKKRGEYHRINDSNSITYL